MIAAFLTEKMGLRPETLATVAEAERALSGQLAEVDAVAEFNQYKVLHAMQENRLSDAHFVGSTGYGYHDTGRDALEKVYATVFRAPAALVRPQLISGTHALAAALFGNLRPGDVLLSPTGTPYDTLQAVIGIRPTPGSLAEHGIAYQEIALTADGDFDYDAIAQAISARPIKMATLQRSKGYAWRPSFTVAQLGKLIAFIKKCDPRIICLVDNCYGEFVETCEPTEAGADLMAGSLIKNPGGGLAPVGGYVVGQQPYVEAAATRLTAPGLGMEVGPSLGIVPLLMQGFFLAPQVVGGSVKGAILAAKVFGDRGYPVLPGPHDARTDIVQAIQLGSPEKILAFCRGIQRCAPVDSFVTPEAAPMPGYGHPLVMAAGAFVQGSSIELSADAPMRPPYNVFLQGGLTAAHAKAGVLFALDRIG